MMRGLAKRIALAAAVVALCAGGFFACFERREVEIERGQSREARENHYLALGRLLERMGHRVVVHGDFAHLDRLPEPPATVILPMDRSAFGPRRTQALLDWVARGGHLVVATYTVWAPPEKPVAGEPKDAIVSGRPDLLLDRFGLRQRYADDGDEDDDDDDAKDPSSPAPDDSAHAAPKAAVSHGTDSDLETAHAYIEDDEHPLDVQFSAAYWWDDTLDKSVWTVAGDSGAHLVEVEHGAGRITALTSDEPLLNDWIGFADHAEFVVRWLRDGREAPVPVWIFYAEEWPSWLDILRKNASPALLGGGALLLLWLWRSLFRFGPVLPAPDPARRRWLEHLEAAGHFHWRQDRGRALLSGLRAELDRELERKRPAWRRLPERERLERFAQASGLSLEQVAHALLDEARAPRSFVAAVRSLEQIRAKL